MIPQYLKSWFYRLVDTSTGRVYHGWRYGADRKTIKRILRADYGKRIQIIRLQG